MKHRDFDQAKKILTIWTEDASSYSGDLSFLLESMKDRSYPNEQYLGEEVLSLIEASDGQNGEVPQRILLKKPAAKDEKAQFDQMGQLLRVENDSLGKWPSEEKTGVFVEMIAHLLMKKGHESAYEAFGDLLSVSDLSLQEKECLFRDLVANDVVERAYYLSKYEDPDWAFDGHKFLYGEGEDKTYSGQTSMWYSFKEEKINDHGILMAVSDRSQGEEQREAFASQAKSLCGESGKEPVISVMLSTPDDQRAFFEKLLQPMEKECYGTREGIRERKNQYAEVRKDFLTQLETVKKLQKELSEFQGKALHLLADRELHERTIAGAKSEIEHDQMLTEDAGKVRDGFSEDRKSLDEAMDEMSTVIDQETARMKELEKEINESRQKTTEGFAKAEETLKSVGFMTKLLSKKKYDAAVELSDQYHKEACDAQDRDLELSREAKKLGDRLHELLDQQNQMEEKRAYFTEEIGKRNRDIQGWAQTIEKRKTEIAETQALLDETIREFDKLMESAAQEGESGKRILLDKTYFRELFSEDLDLAQRRRSENPWKTPKYEEERAKLFQIALKLCREFVCASHHCRENLINLEQYFGLCMGDDGKEIVFHPMDRATMVPALYQMLYLLTPVILMTTENVEEIFRDIKKTGIFGRAVVDFSHSEEEYEPKKAVGTLFRSRRALLLLAEKEKPEAESAGVEKPEAEATEEEKPEAEAAEEEKLETEAAEEEKPEAEAAEEEKPEAEAAEEEKPEAEAAEEEKPETEAAEEEKPEAEAAEEEKPAEAENSDDKPEQ